jgi:hypothetical protein
MYAGNDKPGNQRALRKGVSAAPARRFAATLKYTRPKPIRRRTIASFHSFDAQPPDFFRHERRVTKRRLKICAINRSLSVTPCSAQNRAISSSVRMPSPFTYGAVILLFHRVSCKKFPLLATRSYTHNLWRGKPQNVVSSQ